MFSAVAIATLISVCTPWAEPRLLAALVMAGSEGQANLVIDSAGERHVGKSKAEAMRHIAGYKSNDELFIGLTQIPRTRLLQFGVPPEQALDACSNLQIGYQIFMNAYDQAAKVEKSPWKTTALAYSIYRDQRAAVDSPFATKATQYLMTAPAVAPAGMNDPLRHQILALWSANLASIHSARYATPRLSPLTESAAISAWARQQI